MFGGPADLMRPPPDADDITWTNYLFMRENPAGVQIERWVHWYGCGQWFHLTRDSLTHQIVRSSTLNESVAERPLSLTREGT